MSSVQDKFQNLSVAATAIQKLYRGHRARRRMADAALSKKEKGWWNILDAASLQRSTLLYYEVGQTPAPAAVKWGRLKSKAAKVGRGLSQDNRARKLALQHWLEAVDARHRYGHNLNLYYEKWLQSSTKEPFFYWLDVGEGRSLELEECPRKKLQKQLIRYLSPAEREQFEIEVAEGLLRYRLSGELLKTTPKGTKWIFVMDANGKLYVSKKEKGSFQHSSFLAGGAAKAAGRIVCYDGVLEVLEAHSGHYLPTPENFGAMLEVLKDKGTDMAVAELRFESDDVVAEKERRISQKFDPSVSLPTKDHHKSPSIALDDGLGEERGLPNTTNDHNALNSQVEVSGSSRDTGLTHEVTCIGGGTMQSQSSASVVLDAFACNHDVSSSSKSREGDDLILESRHYDFDKKSAKEVANKNRGSEDSTKVVPSRVRGGGDVLVQSWLLEALATANESDASDDEQKAVN